MKRTMDRIVTISLPTFENEKTVKTKLKEDSPYLLVESLPKSWKKLAKEGGNVFGSYEISNMLPIHNATGIRDLKQITKMGKAVKSGKHILGNADLPNIKMVVAPSGRLLVFDGHHSLISYYNQGKRYLSEIPYLVISDNDFGPVTPEEISFFFPKDFREEVIRSWENYTVNWEAAAGNQVEKRRVSNFAELVAALGKRDKSAVKK